MKGAVKSMVKRTFDIFLSIVGLIISFPLWVLFSIVVIMESGSPVFIWQERIGRGGNIFKILKFRTMDKNAHRESPVEHTGERSQRVTFIGNVLRATALDELPQLGSIFLGHMSFVGPRPIHPKEIEITGSRYNSLKDVPGFKRRCSIKPGLTGLAQVYATKDISIDKKIKYDLLYIKEKSFLLDLKLILLSCFITFRRRWESKNKKLGIEK